MFDDEEDEAVTGVVFDTRPKGSRARVENEEEVEHLGEETKTRSRGPKMAVMALEQIKEPRENGRRDP